MADNANVRERFTRTETTWAAYLLLGSFAYFQTLPGPLMPSLQRDLHLSYGVGGLHFGALALGAVGAGLANGWLAERVSRRRLLWGGGAGMAAGGCGLALGHHLAQTVASCALMGLFGATMLITIQAVLALAHGERRAQAVTEANVLAYLGSSVAALAVGVLTSGGLGWRLSCLLGVGIFLVLAARFRFAPLPERPSRPAATTRGDRLLPLFWVYWAANICGVMAEMCINNWGAAYLHASAGFPISLAATLMSLYLAVGFLARAGGSRAVRRWPSSTLLIATAIVALVGSVLFWQAPGGWAAVVGLCCASVGVSNLFPLNLATALGVARTHTDTASARISLSGGLAMLTGPLILGAVADRSGLRAAFSIVPVLLGGMLVLSIGAAIALRRGYLNKEQAQTPASERAAG